MKPTAALIAAGAFALTFAVGGVSGWLSRDVLAPKPRHLKLDPGWNTVEVPLERDPRGWRLFLYAPNAKFQGGLEAVLPGSSVTYEVILGNSDIDMPFSVSITGNGEVTRWAIPVSPDALSLPEDARVSIDDTDGDGLPERIYVRFEMFERAAIVDLGPAIQREIEAWRSGFTPRD